MEKLKIQSNPSTLYTTDFDNIIEPEYIGKNHNYLYQLSINYRHN